MADHRASTSIVNCIRQRHYAEAVSLCEKSIKENPDDIAVCWYLGLSYLLQQDVLSAQATWIAIFSQISNENHHDVTLDLLRTLFIEASYFLRQNMVDEAEIVYQEILEIDPDYKDAYLGLGLTYEYQNDFNLAIKYFLTSVAYEQNDFLAYYHLGYCYRKIGRLESAIEVLNNCLSLNNQFIDAYIELAKCYVLKQNFTEAIANFLRCIELGAVSATIYNELANCARQDGEIQQAIQYLEKAIDLDDTLPEIHSNLGTLLRENGEPARAIPYFEHAIQRGTDNPLTYYNIAICCLDLSEHDKASSYFNKLGVLCRRKGQLDKSIYYHRKAISLSKDHSSAYNNIAVTHFRKGEATIAFRYLQESLQIDPDNIETYYRFGQLLELSNRLREAQSYINKAIEISPNGLNIILIAGRLERRLGHTKNAIELLKKCISFAQGKEEEKYLLVEAHFELGYIFDQKKQADLAFEHFLKGNRFQSEFEKGYQDLKKQYLDRIHKFSRTFTHDWIKSWTIHGVNSNGEQEDKDLFFLLGFPRSGTTLLDRILDSHPNIQVLAEQPILSETIAHLAQNYQPYPEKLASINEGEISDVRAFYFENVSKYISPQENAILIDKHPFHLVDAGTIHRIFPNAKFIFALRHPLDVILSCFMQYFEINEGTSHFFSVEDASSIYKKIMDLWIQYQAVLDLKVFPIYYENLIDSPEEQIRELLGFVGASWDESVMNYAHYARHNESDKKTYTASYSQVVKPIYQTARFRWERYRTFLEPVIPLIAPYAEKFKYSVD